MHSTSWDETTTRCTPRNALFCCHSQPCLNPDTPRLLPVESQESVVAIGTPQLKQATPTGTMKTRSPSLPTSASSSSTVAIANANNLAGVQMPMDGVSTLQVPKQTNRKSSTSSCGRSSASVSPLVVNGVGGHQSHNNNNNNNSNHCNTKDKKHHHRHHHHHHHHKHKHNQEEAAVVKSGLEENGTVVKFKPKGEVAVINGDTEQVDAAEDDEVADVKPQQKLRKYVIKKITIRKQDGSTRKIIIKKLLDHPDAPLKLSKTDNRMSTYDLADYCDNNQLNMLMYPTTTMESHVVVSAGAPAAGTSSAPMQPVPHNLVPLNQVKFCDSSNQNCGNTSSNLGNISGGGVRKNSKVVIIDGVPITSSEPITITNVTDLDDDDDLIDLTTPPESTGTSLRNCDMYNAEIDYMNSYLKSLPSYSDLDNKTIYGSSSGYGSSQSIKQDAYQPFTFNTQPVDELKNKLSKSNSYHSIMNSNTNSGAPAFWKKPDNYGFTNPFGSCLPQSSNKISRSTSSSQIPVFKPIEKFSYHHPPQQATKEAKEPPAVFQKGIQKSISSTAFTTPYMVNHQNNNNSNNNTRGNSQSKKVLNDFWSENVSNKTKGKSGWNYDKIMTGSRDDLRSCHVVNQPGKVDEFNQGNYQLRKNFSHSHLDRDDAAKLRNLSKEDLYKLVCHESQPQFPMKQETTKCAEQFNPISKSISYTNVPISYGNAAPYGARNYVNSKINLPWLNTNIRQPPPSTTTVVTSSPRQPLMLCKSSSNSCITSQMPSVKVTELTEKQPRCLMKSTSSSCVFGKRFGGDSNPQQPPPPPPPKSESTYQQFAAAVTAATSPLWNDYLTGGDISASNRMVLRNNDLLRKSASGQGGGGGAQPTCADNFFIKQNIPQANKVVINYPPFTKISSIHIPINGQLPSAFQSATTSQPSPAAVGKDRGEKNSGGGQMSSNVAIVTPQITPNLHGNEAPQRSACGTSVKVDSGNRVAASGIGKMNDKLDQNIASLLNLSTEWHKSHVQPPPPVTVSSSSTASHQQTIVPPHAVGAAAVAGGGMKVSYTDLLSQPPHSFPSIQSTPIAATGATSIPTLSDHEILKESTTVNLHQRPPSDLCGGVITPVGRGVPASTTECQTQVTPRNFTNYKLSQSSSKTNFCQPQPPPIFSSKASILIDSTTKGGFQKPKLWFPPPPPPPLCQASGISSPLLHTTMPTNILDNDVIPPQNYHLDSDFISCLDNEVAFSYFANILITFLSLFR
ncbi:hypothetical protein DMENIID0001_104850 [Sergentomyia squamirostris]